MSVPLLTPITDRTTQAVAVARLVDGTVRERVLVLGPFPPEGDDLDLVARAPARKQIGATLADEGFLRRGPDLMPPRLWVEQWATFSGGSAFAVDLHPAERWGLRDSELGSLFSDAEPIEGMDQLVRCAPHHVLLLIARRLARRGGELDAKRRGRIDRALAERPDAWTVARERAPLWGLESALALLEAAYRTRVAVDPRTRARAQAEVVAAGGMRWRAQSIVRRVKSARPRRASIVSLSGLDGAGKSSQATALQATLQKLGVDCAIEWMPLGHSARNPTLRRIKRSAAGALSLARRRRPGPQSSNGSRPAAATNPTRSLRQRSELVTQGWVTIVALIQALQHRRAARRHRGTGRIVIFDRYTLDSAAQLRFFYGASHRFRFQKRLVRLVSPQPRMSFLLDVPPETAMVRKELQYTLDEVREQTQLYREELAGLRVRRLDGERPQAELSDEIARAIWQEVGR
jgi:thymidylate kinase